MISVAAIPLVSTEENRNRDNPGYRFRGSVKTGHFLGKLFRIIGTLLHGDSEENHPSVDSADLNREIPTSPAQIPISQQPNSRTGFRDRRKEWRKIPGVTLEEDGSRKRLLVRNCLQQGGASASRREEITQRREDNHLGILKEPKGKQINLPLGKCY